MDAKEILCAGVEESVINVVGGFHFDKIGYVMMAGAEVFTKFIRLCDTETARGEGD